MLESFLRAVLRQSHSSHPLRSSSKRTPVATAGRSLRVEPLEQRALLSVVAADPAYDQASPSDGDPTIASAVLGPVSEFERLAPLGGSMSSSDNNTATLSSAGDRAGFEFYAESGEKLTATAYPDNASATLTIELWDTGGPITGPFGASAPGEPVTLPPTSAVADGLHTVYVVGDMATGITADLHKNLVREVNDTHPGGPVLPVDSSFVNSTGHYGILGESTPTVAPYSHASVLALFGIQPATGNIVQVDPTTGGVVDAFPAPETPDPLYGGLSGAEEGSVLLYQTQTNAATELYRLDPNDGAVLSTESLPLTYAAGLSFETGQSDYIFGAFASSPNPVTVVRQTGYGQPLLDFFTSPGAWWPAHPGALGGDDLGRHFVAETGPDGNHVVEFDPLVSDTSPNSFAVPAGLANTSGLAFDGTHLYLCDTAGTLLTLDPYTGAVMNQVTVAGGGLTGLGVVRIGGGGTDGDLVGIDFDRSGGAAPGNWTQFDGVGLPVTLTDLIDETGTPTPFDLEIRDGSGFANFGADTGLPQPATIPTHTQSLAELSNNLYAGSGSILLEFSDLTPLASYEVYLFGLDTVPSTYEVTMTGLGTPVTFVQSYLVDQLAINDELGDSARSLSSYAEVVTADAAGQIVIDASLAPATSGTVGLGGVAIRELAEDPPTAGIDLMANGGFETGDMTGWTATTTGFGNWLINDGSLVPPGPNGTPLAPITGSYDALTNPNGMGIRTLSQTFVVPSDIHSAVLEFSDRIRNYHTSYVEPYQEYRVLLKDQSGTTIHEVYSTNPGDPLQQIGPNLRSFDLTSVLQPLEGQTVGLVFEEEGTFNYFNVTVDDVSLIILAQDVDAYSIDLAGKLWMPLDVVLSGQDGADFSGQTLELVDEFGVVRATGVPDPVAPGVPAGNFDLGILGFVVPGDGGTNYTIRVSSTVPSDYGILVSSDLAFEAEANDGVSDPLQGLNPTKRAFGYLEGTPNDEDWFLLDLTEGQTTTIWTDTPFDHPSNGPTNTLDPALAVYRPLGSLLAEDHDSHVGQNAQVAFVAPESGTYLVVVYGESGLGEYQLITDWSVQDFGDAPGPGYPTLVADDGARHFATGPTLGATRDTEPNGQPNSSATGDDIVGFADEDGVTGFSTIMVGQTDASVTVNVQNGPARLDAWIDFNGDGSWGGPGEQIADALGVANGDNTVQFDVPSWAISGDTYARFRLSTAGNLAPGGVASDGEVEDYLVSILPPAASSGVFGSQQVITTAANYATSVFAADLDGDGNQDVLSGSADDKVAWYENTGGGGFGGQQVITTAADYATSVFAADLDGDGDLDVLSASSRDDKIAWYENTGGGTFGAQQVITTAADSAWCVFAADSDSDGDLDVLSASWADSKIAWYENTDGVGTFGAQQVITTAASGARSVYAADLDGDGDQDVLSASSNDDKIAWYENTGGGTFGAQQVITTAASGAFSVFAADLDGDGDQDVLSASVDDDKIAWYENTGGGTFGAQQVITTAADGAMSVFAADLDGDGDQDVLSASSSDGKIAWYENKLDEASASFGSQQVITTATDFPESVFAADLDSDGDQDVLSASWTDGKIAWYENLGFDFGDAPAPYPSLLAGDGARHIETGPRLGTARDTEVEGQPDPNALGDDNNGSDDEDGVSVPPLLAPGIIGTPLTVDASATSYLNAWIDYNDNGIWESSEQVAVDVWLVAGSNTLSLNVPLSAAPGQTYARLRLTSYDTGGTLAPTGPANDGEVEDYEWTIENDLYFYCGTETSDTVRIWPGVIGTSVHKVEINSAMITRDPADYDAIYIDGRGGTDTITVHGTDQNETVTLLPGSIDVDGETYQVHATNVEDITVDAGTGSDQVTMTGSAGSNRLYSYADHARLTDSPNTLSYRVESFDSVTVHAPGSGRDYAFLYDSPAGDVLNATPAQVVFTRGDGTAEETVTTANGFQRAYIYATNGGTDTAELGGSDTTRNRFYGYADYSILTESRRSFYFYARGFETVAGNSSGTGTTYAYLYDSTGNDTFEATTTSATMNREAPWPDTTADGFNRIYAYSTRGGSDTATLNGSATGGNQYRGYPTYSTLTDTARSFYHYARGFRTVTATGSQTDTSGDRAYLYDSSGADTLVGRGNSAILKDTAETTYQIEALYFDLVYARSSDGQANDTVDVDNSLIYNLIRSGTW